MRKYFLALVLFLAITSFSEAALCPLEQSRVEIARILDDPRFYHSLKSGELICEIMRTERGYTVFTNQQVLEIEVHYLKLGHIGPAQFELQFHPAQPLSP